MTNDRQPSTSQFKQVFYKKNRDKPYTQSKMGHDDYLQTEVWKQLRNERLAKDDYRCQKCGTAYNVQVHHLRYPEVWGEENVDDDLITLCSSCHAETHKYDISGRRL